MMKRLFILITTFALFSVAAFSQTTPVAPTTTLKVGDTAPDFTLTDTTGQKVKLSDFRSKNNVVLAFYIFAFTGG
jgi:peroxiredoxin